MAPTAELLPPKRQAVVDRLRRRMENYRRHQNDCMPRFDYSFNGLVEQNMQDTLLLKKNFLDNKVKKTSKKAAAEKKAEASAFSSSSASGSTSSAASHSMQQPQKVDINTKLFSQNKNSQDSPKQETKLSVQIVQQLEFTTSASNSQVSTNVTVTTLNTSVKSETPQSSPAPSPATIVTDSIKCKKEPENSEFVDLEQCAAALEKDAAANGSNTFASFPDLIGDNSGNLISNEDLNDLISEMSDFPSELLGVFDFNQKPQIKLEPLPASRSMSPQINGQQQPNNMRFAPGVDFSNPEMSPAAQTLKQMAEQHQHKTQMRLGQFNPRPPSNPSLDFQFNNSNQSFTGFRQSASPRPLNIDNIKHETLSGQSSPKMFRMSTNDPQNKLGSPYQRFPSFTTQDLGGGNPGGGPNDGYNPGRQLPRGTFQISQMQQLHAQGQVNVSMAQSLNADIKETKFSIASSQTANILSKPDAHYSMAQTQTMDFDTRHQEMKPQPYRMHNPMSNMMNQMATHHNNPVPDYSFNRGFQLPMKGIPQRMRHPQPTVIQQPTNQYIPQQQQQQPRPQQMRLPYRTMNPNMWMHRPQIQEQFVQAQGVCYSTGDTRLNANQIQHGLMQQQQQHQQHLNLQHIDQNTAMRIEMDQKIERSLLMQQHQQQQHQQQQQARNLPKQTMDHQSNQPFVGIPADFNLDFLDLPTGDSASFPDQDFLNSL